MFEIVEHAMFVVQVRTWQHDARDKTVLQPTTAAVLDVSLISERVLIYAFDESFSG